MLFPACSRLSGPREPGPFLCGSLQPGVVGRLQGQRGRRVTSADPSIIAQDHTCCEVALRRLAAWIHERRTGDKDAAQSMLAIKPSFSSDVAPSWLGTEAASYSQSEHKSRERARAQAGSTARAASKGGRQRKEQEEGWGQGLNRWPMSFHCRASTVSRPSCNAARLKASFHFT